MATQVQLRRGNTSQTNAFTGAVAEITIDTDKETIVVHDGSTAGGFPLARESALSTNLTFTQAAFNAANAAGSSANVQAAFNKANSANVLAQAAFDAANTVSPLDSYARTTANTASANTIYTQSVDVTQNTRLSSIETINTDQNTAISIIQGVDVTQNTNITNADAKAQAAFNAANTKFSSSGGTITGDTVVTGNLTITGATVYANTENLTVKDNIITLNSNVTGAPSLSAGLEVNRGSSTNTKLLWSEANTAWEFTNDGTTYEKIAGLTYVQSAFNKANSANVLAQAAFDAANTVSPLDSYARTTANTASANTIYTQSVDVTQNTRMAIIEGVDTTQNTNITIATNAATGAFAQANATAGGLTSANSRITISEGVDVGQNTRMSIIEGVDVTQNTNITNADTKSQAAFDKANAANSLAQAAYNQANTGGGTLDQYARDTANSASSNTIIIQGVDSTQNTRLSSIETININQNTNIQTAFDKANTAPKTTTSTTAPSSPNAGDLWYDTDYDVLLRYTYDGTANNWIDITGPTIGRSTYIRPTYLISANVA